MATSQSLTLSQRKRYKQLLKKRESQQLSRSLNNSQIIDLTEVSQNVSNISIPISRLHTDLVNNTMVPFNRLSITFSRLHTDLENNTMIPIRRLSVTLNRLTDTPQEQPPAVLSQEIMPPPPPPRARPVVRPNPQQRRRHAVVPRRVTYKNALTMSLEEMEELVNNPYYLGPMTDMCEFCGALYFTEEKSNRAGIRLSCCKNGAYSLPTYSSCPAVLKNLFIGNSANAIEFRREIRSINSVFAMASFKTSKQVEEVRGQGQWSFSVCGQIYHMYGGIPGEHQLRNPMLNHFYFLDSEEALERRNEVFNMRINNDILRIVETTLRSHNRYIIAYKTIGEMLREEPGNNGSNFNELNVIVGFTKDPTMNARRRNFDLPDSRSEIAAVFQGDEPPFDVDLVLYPHNPNASQQHRRHHRLKSLNPMADPMVYPLLFPRGDNGYSIDLYYNNNRVNRNNRVKSISMNEYYRYRLHVRDGFSTLHSGGKLFQQFIVDNWCKIETNRLWYIRKNQEKFRLATELALRRLSNAAANRGENLPRVGKPIILPTRFEGGDRHRQRQYLDAMTVITRHGKPDLFITMTCNPRWREIRENLGQNQKVENRPELVCRVFHAKLLELMEDIVNKQMFGVVLNYHYVIEFQKRGLPHAHIVITMHPNDKILDIEAVDEIIRAYIPDINTEPNLYGLVKDFHVHNPCGRLHPNAICMKDNKCKKFYPKAYKPYTSLHAGDNKRPEYKRPNDGRRIYLEQYHQHISNRRIVPYNPYLLAKFVCHINVEVVGSLYTMKYLHKYINKPNDAVTLHIGTNTQNGNGVDGIATPTRTTTTITNDGQQRQQGEATPAAAAAATTTTVDEIKQYQEFRYVSSMEATWRILEFKMHDRSHSVIVLPVHLHGQRTILYEEFEDGENIERRLQQVSKLEAYFRLNQRDEEARQYLYAEIPEHYTWNNSNYEWKKRSQISKQIGCMVPITPSTEELMELFFLRIVLSKKRGCKSFEELRTLEDGTICETYKQVCRVNNYIRNTDEFDRAMGEAALQCHPRKLRRLFALYCCIIFDEGVLEFGPLWTKYRNNLIEDYVVLQNLTKAEAERKAYEYVENIMRRNRPNMSLRSLNIVCASEQQNQQQNSDSDDDDDDEEENEIRRNVYRQEMYDEDLSIFERRIQRRLNHNDDEDEDETYSPMFLNPDQKRIFLKIMKMIAKKNNLNIPLDVLANISDVVSIEDIQEEINPRENIFYIDGPGGTGKTHLYNTIITCVKKYFAKRCISVAWTGIAANLLIDGTTVHRAFKLPINLTDKTMPGWAVETPESQGIANDVILIVWDEAPMTQRLAVEAVDRYLRDITNINEPMGGKCCVLGGDFRQILPVIVGGHKHDVINASLKRSILWKSIVQVRLNFNMRARQYPELIEELQDRTYSEWLLELGNGNIPYITLSSKAIIGGSSTPKDIIEIPHIFQLDNVDQLIDFVYEDDYVSRDNGKKAILCPTNAAVAHVNNMILNKMTNTEEKTYFSVDEYKKDNDDDNFHVTMDLLNSIEAASLPPHQLKLKIGVIVMILKNIDVEDGICNGSRVRVISLGEHIIECELLNGYNAGRKIFIPKIRMVAQDTMLPKPIIRFQFPIKLAYAITINKSQGQSLDKVGIYLQKSCFTHGQLYVAFSRVGTAENVKILIDDNNQQGTFKFRGTRRFTRNVVFFEILNVINDERSSLINTNLPPRRLVLENDSDMEDNGNNNDYDDEDNDNDQIFFQNSANESLDNQDHIDCEVINELQDFETDEALANIDINQYVNTTTNRNELFETEDKAWKGAIPVRDRTELLKRIAYDEEPGTSRLIDHKKRKTVTSMSSTSSTSSPPPTPPPSPPPRPPRPPLKKRGRYDRPNRNVNKDSDSD